MAWRYRLERRTAHWFAPLAEVSYLNEWVTLHDGWMVVRPGYAWDGCSPSFNLAGTALWLGVPDGPLGPDGRPVGWRASLFHDALCQFRRDIPGVTRQASVAVLAGLLAADGAPRWMQRLYPAAVQLFGPQDFLGDAPCVATL